MATTITSLSALSADMATAISGATVLVLILLLAQRELASVSGGRLSPMSRVLMVVIAPLLVVFVSIVISRLAWPV